MDITNVEILHSAVLASIPEQIFVLDQSGCIIDANEYWYLFAEHRPPGPFSNLKVGQHFLRPCIDAGSEGDAGATQLAESVAEVIRGQGPRRRLEFPTLTAAGAVWFEIMIEPLRRAGGGAVMIWRDITSRKQADAHARAQHEQLAHLGRVAVLGALSGAFAHELNQPLTSILANAEAALQMLAQPGADLVEVRSMLGDVVADDLRAAAVIQRLREMLTRGEISRQPIDLNSVITEVIGLARSDLALRHVEVSMELHPCLPLAFGDRIQLQQVMLNLIVNACEAMSGVDVRSRKLWITTRFDNLSLEVACSVRDSGCGLASGDLKRIFQPFVSTKVEGMGMGLAICHSIIEAHGGRLWAENALNGGAVFTFTAKTAL